MRIDSLFFITYSPALQTFFGIVVGSSLKATSVTTHVLSLWVVLIVAIGAIVRKLDLLSECGNTISYVSASQEIVAEPSFSPISSTSGPLILIFDSFDFKRSIGSGWPLGWFSLLAGSLLSGLTAFQ